VYYILPAIFRIKKPYPLYNRYDFCPPDILHTILGGYLKDFIFNTCVVVNELKTLERGRYRNSLTLLNEMVRNFPVGQTAAYGLKRFHEGVTPYVVNKKGSKKKSNKNPNIQFFTIHMQYLITHIRFFNK